MSKYLERIRIRLAIFILPCRYDVVKIHAIKGKEVLTMYGTTKNHVTMNDHNVEDIVFLKENGNE